MDMKEAMGKVQKDIPVPPFAYFEKGADEKPHLRRELTDPAKVERIAEEWAREGLEMHQLNRFFRHCRSVERMLKREKQSWEEARPTVDFLASAAADAYSKSPPKIPPAFLQFIRNHVQRVQSAEDFCDGFLKHFEAVFGFAALHIKKG